jgi:hypothetical protein
MNPLNCGIGDLAITVSSQLPENYGTIVRIVSAVGLEKWLEHDELLYTWNVEVATEGGALFYECEDGIASFTSGPAPDIYLRRLTPPQGYLLEEFSESEQLQMELYEQDCLEGDE